MSAGSSGPATEVWTGLTPAQEAARLSAVRRYDILDTPPDGAFDRITAIAAELFSVPISIISLVDHDRIWFKSHHGLDVPQTGRDPGLCASAILHTSPWVVADAGKDVRTLANPLVAGNFGLRFYVGVPLHTSDGFNLGTLCVIDKKPRAVDERQIALLNNLAVIVMDEMELRLSARRAVAELSDTVAQKEAALRQSILLAKEIDHRVMNSLQLISSLLEVQSRALGDAEASQQLSVAAGRVAAIAKLNQHLYLSDSVGSVEFKGYLQRLCHDLSGMLRPVGRGEITVSAVDASFANERTVFLGLLANELIMNAIKHGVGTVTVSFERIAPEQFRLAVADEGTSFGADFDPAAHSGLGMKVIATLVRQLGGALEVIPGTATTFAIAFPA